MLTYPTFNFCHARLFGWFEEPRCLIEGGLAYSVRLLSFSPNVGALSSTANGNFPV